MTDWLNDPASLVALIGFVGTAINVWITAKIKLDIADLKNYCGDTFVKKEDMPLYLGPLRQAYQVKESSIRPTT